jgi:hypothetical protein
MMPEGTGSAICSFNNLKVIIFSTGEYHMISNQSNYGDEMYNQV